MITLPMYIYQVPSNNNNNNKILFILWGIIYICLKVFNYKVHQDIIKKVTTEVNSMVINILLYIKKKISQKLNFPVVQIAMGVLVYLYVIVFKYTYDYRKDNH